MKLGLLNKSRAVILPLSIAAVLLPSMLSGVPALGGDQLAEMRRRLNHYPATAGSSITDPAAALCPGRDAEIMLLAQRKQYDLGNCYQWKSCRGDSIGNAWINDPCFCAIKGGKSWMDARQKCHDLIDGPFGTECR